jgi:hypothetical protein
LQVFLQSAPGAVIVHTLLLLLLLLLLFPLLLLLLLLMEECLTCGSSCGQHQIPCGSG